jgi:sugar phosphate isomerase/epimerase
MRIGIFAKTFAGADPQTVLAKARNAGYACVQYNFACSGLASMPDDVPDAAIDAIRAASTDSGVAIAALSATYNMIHPDVAVRIKGMARLKTAIEVAKRLDIPVVTLCTGTRDPDDQWRHHPDNDRQDAWSDLVVEMEKAAALADAHGIALGIEPELANVVSSADKAARLLIDVSSPSLGIVLDPANLFEHAEPDEARDIVARSVDKVAGRIIMAHAKDRDAAGGFVAAGRGVVDFADLVFRLRQSGFDGAMVTHGLEESQAADVSRFLAGLL